MLPGCTACRKTDDREKPGSAAALSLRKGAKAIRQSGRWYTDDNTDVLLLEHRPAKKARRGGKHHMEEPPKLTEEDDRRFAESFERLITEMEAAE